MGKLMVDSIKANDNEVVLSVTLVGAVLGTLCVLLADLCYAIADPRVSYE